MVWAGWRTFTGPSTDPRRWAEQRDLQVVPSTERVIRSHLLWFHGVVSLFSTLAFVVLVVWAPDWYSYFFLVILVGGFLVGTILGELLANRPTSELPAATLVPRELADFVPRGYTLVLRLASVLGAMTAAGVEIVLPSADPGSGFPGIGAQGIVIVVVWLTIELGQRYIVRRPQPAFSEDLIRADDALRVESLRTLTRSGISLNLVICGTIFGALRENAGDEVLRWTFGTVGISAVLLGLFLLMRLREPRGPRRTLEQGMAP
jgi:hypothetical protein